VPVALKALPPVDVVMISHDHYDHLDYPTIRERLGPFDLVMLEVGAYHPSWGHIHLGPQNALEALTLLGGGAFLPVHWGTFSLSTHAWDEPAETLLALAPSHEARLVMPKLGEAVEPAHAEAVLPWWRAVDAVALKLAPEERAPPETLPKSVAWPLD
jgi:L-ascorbate metabolism protein UlaG (beta-lactamase superfamily)